MVQSKKKEESLKRNSLDFANFESENPQDSGKISARFGQGSDKVLKLALNP